MKTIDRITFDPEVMGGKPCIRGMRVTVGTLVGLVAAGRTRDEILKLYPYLDDEDIAQALTYAAWRKEIVGTIEYPAVREGEVLYANHSGKGGSDRRLGPHRKGA